MVSSIVGNYLVEKGLISEVQLTDIYAEQRKVRVKLGLIAVAEGLMTQEEADRVNQLQAVMDKRFGDIAVEKGYLTSGQVDSLLKKQGNAYLTFAQALENQQLMSVEQLEQYLLDYQCENSLTASDMEAIKSDDVDRILRLYLPVKAEGYLPVATLAVRTLIRLIDSELYPEKAYLTAALPAEKAAIQYVDGTVPFSCGMAGNGNDLIDVASIFGQEQFEEVDEDALDAIAELMNCINGLYASALSKDGISTELMPPEYSVNLTQAESEEMLVIPLMIKGNKINFLIAIDRKIEIK